MTYVFADHWRAGRGRDIPTVIAIDTTPRPCKEEGGHCWDVTLSKVSGREEIREARKRQFAMLAQRAIN